MSDLGLPVPRRYWAALTIWLILAMTVMDGSICNVSLPAIARDVHATPSAVVWVVNAYQLTIVLSLLPLAALGQVVGYRRVSLAGIGIFTLASIGCLASHTLAQLILARGLQGFGAAGIMSVNGALVRFTFPLAKLGAALGLNALVTSAASACGPSVASAILAVGPWPWLFAVNLPIGAAAFFIGRASLPPSEPSGRFDRASAACSACAFGCGFVGIDMLTREGVSAASCGTLTLGIAAAALLVQRSRRQPAPLMPLDLLSNGLISLTVLTSITTFCAQTLALVTLPFYLEDVLHLSQVDTGLLITPWPVAILLGSPLAGRLADRAPAAVISAVGLLLFALGLAALGFLGAGAAHVDVGVRMALCGLGFSLFQAPNNRTMLSSAPLSRAGASAGLLATARLTGQILGATLAAITLRMGVHAESTALSIAAASALLAAGASLARLGRRGISAGITKPLKEMK